MFRPLIDRLRALFQQRPEALPEHAGEQSHPHLAQAADSLRGLLTDPTIPAEVRAALDADYRQLESMLDKLDQGALHLAVFGRVSVGKSAMLNALLGREAFDVGVLHGTTRTSGIARWQEAIVDGVHLFDTPGINELGGEERERIAHEVAQRADLVLFVVDSDMTQTEREALAMLHATERPILLVLNKADRYSAAERDELLTRLREHAAGMVKPENVLCASAAPAARQVIRIDAQGNESESREVPAIDVTELKARILQVLEREGRTLAALNASLFAGRLSEEIARRVRETRREVAEGVTRTYCISKGVAVALNPLPVADLLAAAGLDVALVIHLGRVYGMRLEKTEAAKLVGVICAQLALLMGAVWGVHLVSSALKGLSAGLSTALTAGAQGALAYYATYLVGRAAEGYLMQGKSWGDKGPKRVVQDILDSLDRDSILREARKDILARLKLRS